MKKLLIVLAGFAFTVDSVYTGKTWCNYVCPISFVEKIYTEPRNLRPTANSQCVKCTACKAACPDINEENSYWKDIRLPAKRHVYFSFPGLVLAFYVYYYLQAGTWEYYFGGGWTTDRLLASIMAPNHAYTVARGMDPEKDKGYPNDRLFIARYTLPISYTEGSRLWMVSAPRWSSLSIT